MQEFRGVVGSEGSPDLQADASKLSIVTLQILAACHALVVVDNKLVSPSLATLFTASQNLKTCLKTRPLHIAKVHEY